MVLAGVVLLGMCLKGDPKVPDHGNPFFGPLLLFYCSDQAIVCLTEFFPGEMLVFDFVLPGFS